MVLLKKELLLSFLAGLVLPLALAAAFQHSPEMTDVESDALSPTAARVDSKAVLTVQNRAGNLQQLTLAHLVIQNRQQSKNSKLCSAN